jgi:peroxiredoxin
MHIPSRRALLIFSAGFGACLLCVVACFGVLVLSAIHSKHKWEQANEHINTMHLNFDPPDIFIPRPADFDFAAVDASGKRLDFKDVRGRVVVLNVWETWCVPCLAELPTFSKLAARYSADKDVAVVCLSQEPAERVFKNEKAKSSGAPLYSSNERRLPNAYRTKKLPAPIGIIPTTFIIDRNGTIVFRGVGAADWSAPSVIEIIDSLKQRSNKAD